MVCCAGDLTPVSEPLGIVVWFGTNCGNAIFFRMVYAVSCYYHYHCHASHARRPAADKGKGGLSANRTRQDAFVHLPREIHGSEQDIATLADYTGLRAPLSVLRPFDVADRVSAPHRGGSR